MNADSHGAMFVIVDNYSRYEEFCVAMSSPTVVMSAPVLCA